MLQYQKFGCDYNIKRVRLQNLVLHSEKKVKLKMRRFTVTARWIFTGAKWKCSRLLGPFSILILSWIYERKSIRGLWKYEATPRLGPPWMQLNIIRYMPAWRVFLPSRMRVVFLPSFVPMQCIVCLKHFLGYVMPLIGNLTEENCLCIQRHLPYGNFGSYNMLALQCNSKLLSGFPLPIIFKPKATE
jgi:hypothetical protein